MRVFMPNMKISKIKSYVGFAVKSRGAIFGVDNIVKLRKPALVLVDKDLSANSQNRLKPYLEKAGVVCYTVPMEEIYNARNCKAVAITDPNLANAVERELKEIKNE